ncbi:TPA_asm: hypothetical protein G4H14_004536 [Salmonella enterica subsp. enterica serovar Poona]|uniref:Uncharacterized protein n=1 Tax=Salmonella enterica subsp. enterica serovar Poona TaxID=436295 RepID=A0A731V0F4_SALET|nr:hypothetical protein [Salmonella enterica subsp. enterica serovar Poona]
MRMPALCRCVAYGYAVHIWFTHFSTADPKKGIAGTEVTRTICYYLPCTAGMG